MYLLLPIIFDEEKFFTSSINIMYFTSDFCVIEDIL